MKNRNKPPHLISTITPHGFLVSSTAPSGIGCSASPTEVGRRPAEIRCGGKKVFAAMSGGVDSSVAAALLKERGFEVVGVHIKMWSDPSIPCNFKEDRYDAMRAAEKIGIPFQTWDFTGEYRRAVVEYMIREYAAGRTPNPDVACNRHIKFGVFLAHALRQGADYIATGHYVRKSEIRNQKSETSPKPSSPTKIFGGGQETQNPKLLTARDQNKDQSYFLWTLTQEQLRRCLFPIGEYVKPQVREMARERGLPTAEKKDSQGICFIGEINLRDFLQNYIPTRPGLVVTSRGRVIGEHEGLSFYTIGQRQGLGIGGGIPYYVAEKDFSRNALVVAEGPYDENLFKRELVVTDINWIAGQAPKLPLRCEARIRYRQSLQCCSVEARADRESSTITRTHADSQRMSALVQKSASVRVIFDENQPAATPGQSVVFYRGEEMLGGGIIASAQ